MNDTDTVATPAEIRAWAKEAGRTDVGDRGRISNEVKHAFMTETGRRTA